MATECISMVRGKVVRITALDECGAVEDDALFAVSDGFISVALSAEVEAGDEFIQKNANGDLCINERAPDALKRLNVQIDWCRVDPDIINLITGFPVEVSDTDVVGFRIETGTFDTNYALEVWTGLAGAACGDGQTCYGYILVPFVTGATLTGDITIENGAATFQTSGYTSLNSEWGVGPWNVIGEPPAPLDDEITSNQVALLRTTCVAPPAASCGAQSLGSPA